MVEKVTESIFYVGANDHDLDLFEGQYIIPNGMAYNSYVIVDDKIVVFDTIDKSKTGEWLDNLAEVLGERTPDYLVVQHMEPDHSASITGSGKPQADLRVCTDGSLAGSHDDLRVHRKDTLLGRCIREIRRT